MQLHAVDPPTDFAEIASAWPLAEHSRFVRCGSINWHLQQIGEKTNESLLLVHGTGGSTHSMAPLAQTLADRFHITIADLPGHGFTRGAANRHYTLPGMARALAALVNALDIEPMLAVGHSAGAAILLQSALENEMKLRGIVGINAALEPIEGNAFFSPLAKALFVNPFVPSAVAWQARYTNLARSLLKNTGSPLDQIDVEAYNTLLNKPSHIGGALGMMANWDLKPLRQRLPELRIPVELVVADDDKMVPSRVSRESATEAEAIKLFSIEAGGHLIHEIRPDIIARRVDTMAASLKEAVR